MIKLYQQKLKKYQPNAKASKFPKSQQPTQLQKTMKNSMHRKTGNCIIAATLTNKKHPIQKTMNEPNRTEPKRTEQNGMKMNSSDIFTTEWHFEIANIVYKAQMLLLHIRHAYYKNDARNKVAEEKIITIYWHDEMFMFQFL